MEKTLKSLVNLFEFNNALFSEKIFSLSEEIANHRIDHVNPIVWVAGHLVSSRNHVLNLVGVERDFLYEDTFKGGFDEKTKYPTMLELGSEFDDITGKLFNQLKNISEDQLNKDLGYDLPNQATTVGGSLVFWLYHEAWHLGQIAVIRRSQNMEGVVPY